MTRKKLIWLEKLVKGASAEDKQQPAEEPGTENRIVKNGEIEAIVIEKEMADGEV